jgi:hypothetical protein
MSWPHSVVEDDEFALLLLPTVIDADACASPLTLTVESQISWKLLYFESVSVSVALTSEHTAPVQEQSRVSEALAPFPFQSASPVPFALDPVTRVSA